MDFNAALQKLANIKSSCAGIEESRVLFDLINGRQNPLGIIQALHQQKSTVEHLEELQGLMTQLVVEVPFTQACLVALFEAFYRCPDENIQGGIWDRFGMDEGDLYSSILHNPERAAEYININGFEAQLWQALGNDIEQSIFSSPIRNFADSIEKAEPDDGIQCVDTEVAAACLWVIHAGLRIWTLSKNKDRDDRGKTVRGDLWTGERGYSVERWTFWKKRFQDVAEGKMKGVNAETRRLAAAAVENMHAVNTLDP